MFGRSLAVLLGLVAACKPSLPATELKTVERLEDDQVCAWVEQQTQQGWRAGGAQTRAQHYEQVKRDELAVVDLEIRKYTARAEELEREASSPAQPQAPTGAQTDDEPTGGATPGDGGAQTEDEPADADLDDGFSLQGGGATVSTAGICADCTAAEARRIVTDYTRRRGILAGCAMDPAREPAPAASPAAETDDAEAAASRTRWTNFYRTLSRSALGEACRQIPNLLPPDHVSGCDKAIITSVCTTFANAANEGAIGAAGGETGAPNLTDTLFTQFRAAAVGCIEKATAEQLRQAITGSATAGSLDARARVALAVCQAAGSLVGSYLQNTHQSRVDMERPCAAVTEMSRSRMASCFQTASTGCRAGAGTIDVANLLPPGATDGDVERIVSQIASAGVSGACSLGGAATSALCGTISEAAGQIREALTSADGTNSWANCVGTDQAGACVGTLWAQWQTGVTLESLRTPVATAQTNAQGETTKQCCYCYRDFYEDGWVSDTRFRRDHVFRVTKNDGGVDCRANMTTRKHNGGITQYHNGYQVYYNYSECAVVEVKGDACLFQTSVYPNRDSPITVEWRPTSGGAWRQSQSP